MISIPTKTLVPFSYVLISLTIFSFYHLYAIGKLPPLPSIDWARIINSVATFLWTIPLSLGFGILLSRLWDENIILHLEHMSEISPKTLANLSLSSLGRPGDLSYYIGSKSIWRATFMTFLMVVISLLSTQGPLLNSIESVQSTDSPFQVMKYPRPLNYTDLESQVSEGEDGNGIPLWMISNLVVSSKTIIAKESNGESWNIYIPDQNLIDGKYKLTFKTIGIQTFCLPWNQIQAQTNFSVTNQNSFSWKPSKYMQHVGLSSLDNQRTSRVTPTDVVAIRYVSNSVFYVAYVNSSSAARFEDNGMIFFGRSNFGSTNDPPDSIFQLGKYSLSGSGSIAGAVCDFKFRMGTVTLSGLSMKDNAELVWNQIDGIDIATRLHPAIQLVNAARNFGGTHPLEASAIDKKLYGPKIGSFLGNVNITLAELERSVVRLFTTVPQTLYNDPINEFDFMSAVVWPIQQRFSIRPLSSKVVIAIDCVLLLLIIGIFMSRPVEWWMRSSQLTALKWRQLLSDDFWTQGIHEGEFSDRPVKISLQRFDDREYLIPNPAGGDQSKLMQEIHSS